MLSHSVCSQDKPLKNIKVLDLSRILAGPWCSQILADLGATVIKVERPFKGDDTRSWKSSTLKDSEGKDTDESAYYLAANRGKKSITIDFSMQEGQDIIKQLAQESDILLENYKTNQLRKYGLDWESLHKLNPRLVYCSVTGFGQNGPYSTFPGYDYIIQAMSGLMSVTGAPDNVGGGHTRCGVPLVDLSTGLYATIAILAALHKRNFSGQGEHIDIALFDSAVSLMSIHIQNTVLSGKNPQRIGNQNPYVVPYQVFQSSDHPFVLAVGNDTQFRQLLCLLEIPELGDREEFRTNASRLQHRNELDSVLSLHFKTKPRDFWITLLRSHNIPVGPINSVKELLQDPQFSSRNLIFPLPHKYANSDTGISMVSSPIRFTSGQAECSMTPPPIRGQDTYDVLSSLGLSDSEIQKLKINKVVE